MSERITRLTFKHKKVDARGTERFSLGEGRRRIYLSHRSDSEGRPWRVWVTGTCDVSYTFGTREAALARVHELLGEELLSRWSIKRD